ncbi:alpha/beta hydrolase [Terrisporobacter sp.]
MHEKKDSNTIIIFVHGIVEGPDQFKSFAKEIEDDYSYSAVLLNGHGTSGRNFVRSNKEKWIETVEREILKYKDNYENIILVGHSMGSLISILLSLKYTDKVKGLILIATPLKVFVKWRIVISSIRYIFKKEENNKLAKEIAKMVSIDRCSLFTYTKWAFKYMDLFYLIYITKKHLNEIKVPTLIIQSESDELVSYKSLNIFKNKLKNKYKIFKLKNSGHFCYQENELKGLFNESKSFIKNILKNLIKK